jgi:heptosyltransferase-1
MDHEGPKGMNILIVKLSAVGDVIHTLPSLAALRRCFPDAHITWAVEEAASDLLAGHPDIDQLLVSRRKSWLRDIRQGRIKTPLKEINQFLKELRSRPYEIVIDFHGLLKSAVIVLLSGGKRRLGYNSMQELSGLFYNEKIPEAMGKHAVDRYLDFVRYLAGERHDSQETACLTGKPEFRIHIGDEERRRVKALLDAHPEIIKPSDNVGDGKDSGGRRKPERQFVAVNTVAFWETKLWEENKFAELCDQIDQRLGIGVVLTGTEAGPLDRIIRQMKRAAVNLGGRTTLRELASLYSEAALVVTTDSGPMHLAAAVGTPVIALFGPTDPLRTGPYGTDHKVIRLGLSCSPCFRKTCKAPRCMTDISVEEVFSAVKERLGR